MAQSTTKSQPKPKAKSTPKAKATKATPKERKLRKGRFDSPAIVKYVTTARKPVSAEQVARHLKIEVTGPLHVRLGWLAAHDGLIAMSEGVPASRRTYGKVGTTPAPLTPPKVTRKAATKATPKSTAKGTRKPKADPGKGRTKSRRGRDSIGAKSTPRDPAPKGARKGDAVNV